MTDVCHRLLSLEELVRLSPSERVRYFLLRAYMATQHAEVIAEALQAIGWIFYEILVSEEEMRARYEKKEHEKEGV